MEPDVEDAVDFLNRGQGEFNDDLNMRDTGFGMGDKSSLTQNLKRLEGHVVFEDDDEERKMEEDKKKKEAEKST